MRIGPPATPPIVKNLIIANAAVFFLQLKFPALLSFGAAWPILIWGKWRLWQVFTYMWMHGGFGHLAMNMFALWMFGSQLAGYWGSKRFFRYYIVCGVGAGFMIATFPYMLLFMGVGSRFDLQIPTLGASGAVYGVLLAYSVTWPNRKLMLLFPPIPFRAIWLIPLLFVMTIMFSGSANVSHIGHLGGVLIGYLYLKQMGYSGGVFDLGNLKKRWKLFRLGRQLREVKKRPFDEKDWLDEVEDEDKNDDHRTFH